MVVTHLLEFGRVYFIVWGEDTALVKDTSHGHMRFRKRKNLSWVVHTETVLVKLHRWHSVTELDLRRDSGNYESQNDTGTMWSELMQTINTCDRY